MINGCLNDDTRLEYWVKFPYGDGILLDTVSDSSSKLPFNRSELPITGLEVTITAVIPDLQLIGTPLPTDLYQGKFVCLPMTSILLKYFATSKITCNNNETLQMLVSNYMYVYND